jgi:hypothetical protein
VSVIWFVVIAAAAGALTLVARAWPRGSAVIGVLGLAVSALVAVGIRPGDEVALGGSTLTASAYARLFLGLGCVTSLILVLSTGSWRAGGDLSAAALGALALAGVVLAIDDPIQAALAATVGGVFGVLVTLGSPTVISVGVAARELRALVIAGALVLGAIAWSTGIAGTAGSDLGLLGLAYLAGVVAVAIRFGAIPFHLWAARVADAAPGAALPLVMAWAPATLALAALGWIDGSIPVGTGLGLERAVIVLVAALTVVLASVAATVHDDLEHIVGYGIIADAGFVILALATLDSTVGQPARAYVLIYLCVKSALAAWAAVLRSTFGVRRVAELGGWARRSPLLAFTLLIVIIATIGLPGVLAWDSRASVAFAVLGSPLAIVFVLAGLAPAAYLGRLVLIGYERTSPIVASGPHPWPRIPEGARPRDPGSAFRWFGRAWELNRAPMAASWVLVLAGIALALSAGALGVREAAAGIEGVTGLSR